MNFVSIFLFGDIAQAYADLYSCNTMHTATIYIANIIKLWLRKDTKEINRKNTKIKSISY